MTNTHLLNGWFQCGESLAAVAYRIVEGSLQPKNDAKPPRAPAHPTQPPNTNYASSQELKEVFMNSISAFRKF
jgi:hypothetical protein